MIVCVDYVFVLRFTCVFFLMIRRPPRSTLDRSSAASDVYKRQVKMGVGVDDPLDLERLLIHHAQDGAGVVARIDDDLSLIHISEPTRPY